MSQIRQKAAPGYGLAKACDYLLRRWESFARYAETGELPIDNNPVENAIRPIALGRRTGCSRAANGPGSVGGDSKSAGDSEAQRH